MKISMKKSIGSLVVLAALCVGMAAEAGSIPANNVPLQTYAYKKVLCYTSPGGARKGYIDPGDYVIVEKIQNGWAYGSYPVGKSRVKRWFKANDLIANVSFANQTRYSPTNNTYVYRDPSHKSNIGSFWGNETITVVSNAGNSRQIIYKLNNGGYKMGWVPYWDCWTYEQAHPNVKPTPIVTPSNSWSANVGKQLANINSANYKQPTNAFKKSYTSGGKYHATNCTWYAWGRMREVTGKSVTFKGRSGNAGSWHNTVKNCKVDYNLSAKSIAERSGHVVFVEYVDSNYVYYSEANVNSKTDLKIQRLPINTFKKKYTWYIHS